MSELLPCPFCGGEANTLHRPHVIDWRYSVGCNDDECRGFIGLSWLYKTEAKAIEAWNTRSDYHGYEQAAIEAWENIKRWNTRSAGTCHVNELDALTQTLSMANGCSWGECSECGSLTPADSVFCVECGAKVVEQ